VPANAYCLLTLLLVPLAIRFSWQPRAMRRFQPLAPQAMDDAPAALPKARVVLIPLVALVIGILGGFPLLSAEPVNVLTVEGWKQSFSGDAGPYALVFGSAAGWIVAMLCFPAKHRHEAAHAAVHGAGSLLPALVVLIFAWSLGSLFEALGTTRHIAELLGGGIPPAWLPLVVFLVGSSMAFTTGSSWGTMGLLMPLALPATLAAAQAAAMDGEPTRMLATMVIGAVFGGATLGDHCSPFSDTTIVSALASGCRTIDHVPSQLPYAGVAAAASCAAYALMAVGFASPVATAAAGIALVLWVPWMARWPRK
jgi:Na+/H+ antiporter NhaC